MLLFIVFIVAGGFNISTTRRADIDTKSRGSRLEIKRDDVDIRERGQAREGFFGGGFISEIRNQNDDNDEVNTNNRVYGIS